MIGHLGARVSALLDGQLTAAEAEEAWAHVYACHACRDLVEHEGWVKTQLAGLSSGPGAAPSDLKGSLLSMPPEDRYLVPSSHGGARRALGVAVIGGGAVGAAMLGVLAIGALPGGAPPVDRRPPASRIDTVSPSSTGGPSAPAPALVGRDGVPADVPVWVRRLAQ